MAVLESLKIPLGTKMPGFELKDPSGQTHKGHELYGNKGLAVIFTCNHCPYAIAVWPRLIHLAQHAESVGINFVAINPNINPHFPEDAPDKMADKIEEWGISFPYLVDDTQQAAREFKAQCTPDIYLFNRDKELVYHGRVDDNWKKEEKVTRKELKEAIDHLAAGEPVQEDQKPSMGCSIKWLE